MKKLLTLFILCLVLCLLLTAPVSAKDYLVYENVYADKFTDALLDYYNSHEIRETEGLNSINISGHKTRIYNVMRTNESLEFSFYSWGCYGVFPLPLPLHYNFNSTMYVFRPWQGLIPLNDEKYNLFICDDDERFYAYGYNWKLRVWNDDNTRFKTQKDDVRPHFDYVG